MTQPPTAPAFQADPSHKRLLKMTAAAIAGAVLARLLAGGSGLDEQQMAQELSTAIAQIISYTGGVTENPNTDIASEWIMFVLSALLAYLSEAASYALKGPVRLIAIFQIGLISIVGLGVAYLFLPVAIKPVMLLAAVILGTASGWVLRLLEERRRKREAQLIELKLREKELLDSRMTLVKQDETERRLLAADLHDQVLNDLKALKTKIDKFGKTGEESLPKEIFAGLDSSMVEIRNIMDALSPVVLEHFGLASAAEECLERGAQRAGYVMDFDNKVESKVLKGLGQVEQQLLYRLIQESITNVCKHANAKRAGISITQDNSQLLIKIKDDGKGIPAERLSESRGLRYMRLRSGLIGASVAWISPDPESGKGTLVEIRHPLQQA